jgi:rhodanese-related sulfurtransferase
MNISVTELKERLSSRKELNIIDVREELEFHTFNVGGKNVPLGLLPSSLEEISINKEDELIVICQRGIRSATAQKILEASGFLNVRNLEGGLLAFRKISS